VRGVCGFCGFKRHGGDCGEAVAGEWGGDRVGGTTGTGL